MSTPTKGIQGDITRLDKPVNGYLGEAKLRAHVGNADRVTPRRMICREAGMPMHWNIFDANGSSFFGSGKSDANCA